MIIQFKAICPTERTIENDGIIAIAAEREGLNV